jgi:hypothetical protein
MLLEWMQAAAHLSNKPCHLDSVGNEGTQNIGNFYMNQIHKKDPKGHLNVTQEKHRNYKHGSMKT